MTDFTSVSDVALGISVTMCDAAVSVRKAERVAGSEGMSLVFLREDFRSGVSSVRLSSPSLRGLVPSPFSYKVDQPKTPPM